MSGIHSQQANNAHVNTDDRGEKTTPKFVNTNVFAALLGCKPGTARRSLCVRGAYMGIVPLKLPNGRLLWPLDEARKILEG